MLQTSVDHFGRSFFIEEGIYHIEMIGRIEKEGIYFTYSKITFPNLHKWF